MEAPAFKLNKKPINYLIYGQPLHYEFHFPYTLFEIGYYKQLYEGYTFLKKLRILNNKSKYEGSQNANSENMYFICIGLHLGIVRKRFEINKNRMFKLIKHRLSNKTNQLKWQTKKWKPEPTIKIWAKPEKPIENGTDLAC